MSTRLVERSLASVTRASTNDTASAVRAAIYDTTYATVLRSSSVCRLLRMYCV